MLIIAYILYNKIKIKKPHTTTAVTNRSNNRIRLKTTMFHTCEKMNKNNNNNNNITRSSSRRRRRRRSSNIIIKGK